MSETAMGVQARAEDAYHRDERFRAMAKSVVREAMDRYGPVDPERAERDAHRIAQGAVIILMQRFYEEDAELRAQKEMADRYRKLAEDTLALSVVPPKMWVAEGQK